MLTVIHSFPPALKLTWLTSPTVCESALIGSAPASEHGIRAFSPLHFVSHSVGDRNRAMQRDEDVDSVVSDCRRRKVKRPNMKRPRLKWRRSRLLFAAVLFSLCQIFARVAICQGDAGPLRYTYKVAHAAGLGPEICLSLCTGSQLKVLPRKAADRSLRKAGSLPFRCVTFCSNSVHIDVFPVLTLLDHTLQRL